MDHQTLGYCRIVVKYFENRKWSRAANSQGDEKGGPKSQGRKD